MAETLMMMNNEADERAAERDERLRLKELEMEERRVEREMKHEQRMFSMLATVLERTSANQMYYQQPPYLPPISGMSPNLQTSSSSSNMLSSQYVASNYLHDDDQ